MDFKDYFVGHFNSHSPIRLSVKRTLKSLDNGSNRIDAVVTNISDNFAVLRVHTDFFLATAVLAGSSKLYDSVVVSLQGDSVTDILIDGINKHIREKGNQHNLVFDFEPYLKLCLNGAKKIILHSDEKIKTKSGFYNRARAVVTCIEDEFAYVDTNLYCVLDSGAYLGGQEDPVLSALKIPTQGSALNDLVFNACSQGLLN